MKYAVEYHPNPDCATIHLSKKIAGESKISIGGILGGKKAEQPVFAKEIMAIDGVVSLRVDEYEVFISKGKVFDWPEILPEIINILAEFADGEGMIEKILSKNDKQKDKPNIIQDFFEIFGHPPSFEEDDEEEEEEEEEDTPSE